MTDHAKRIWLHAIAIVAKARNKCAPGERFEALNLVMGDLEDARRRDQLIMPYFPAVCPDCGQHCETVEKALKPFADMIIYIDPEMPDDYRPSWAEFLVVGDFRRAAAALAACKEARDASQD